MFVVVGLGNPGRDYEDTRHNVGFNVIDLLSQRHNIKLNKIKFKSVYGEGFINGKKVMLVKPQTYMNNSGESLRDIYSFYKVPIENIVVIVDDIDINFAQVKIKGKGSGGSHNGMKSIIHLLKRDDFPRVRIGIGKKRDGEDLARFVLSRFTKDERKIIEESIIRGAEAVETIIEDSVDEAMNRFNKR